MPFSVLWEMHHCRLYILLPGHGFRLFRLDSAKNFTRELPASNCMSNGRSSLPLPGVSSHQGYCFSEFLLKANSDWSLSTSDLLLIAEGVFLSSVCSSAYVGSFSCNQHGTKYAYSSDVTMHMHQAFAVCWIRIPGQLSTHLLRSHSSRTHSRVQDTA